MSTSLEHKRHTLAHLLAAATLGTYPHAHLTLGPAIDDGFYYDIDFGAGEKPNDEALKKIEKQMRKLLPSWKEFTHEVVTAHEAKSRFPGNVYKHELIDEIAARGETITLYTCGNFTDLCRGGHAEHPNKEISDDSFVLDRVAGAYWRGDEKKPALTRIYGLAFDTKAELDSYIEMQKEAEKRDHRKLGKELELFTFDEEIGKGLPLWLPKGTIIKEELENWAKETERAWGYQRVTTPIITKENLFYTSGHLPLYKDSMYAPISIEEENYYIKPMNCPFHHKLFSALPHSYKELPMRLAEYGWCHRYEDSGSLFGLMRVRGMQMNDAHIYVTPEQAVEEFVQVIKLHEYYYKILGIQKYEMELALRDPNKMDKYHGEESDWKLAEEMTIKAMEISGVPFKIAHEGAAFYGPKMDFQIFSATGRSFTASTNQLDLYMGKRFGLEYTDKDGSRKTPYIIHRAPLGTHERFIGFLIEHYAGAFPLWLSPVQVQILPVSEKYNDYGMKVLKTLRDAGLRAEIDDANESLGKKIRNAKTSKVPYIFVVGEKEETSGTVGVETRAGSEGAIPLEQIVVRLTEEYRNRK
ncbi:MAG: threonine--tRNA ligase [Candidatus Pacebacteria bacterium]|nr:threonine--tRNA ligase [Candidatus Paceibacterota bacterium]